MATASNAWLDMRTVDVFFFTFSQNASNVSANIYPSVPVGVLV